MGEFDLGDMGEYWRDVRDGTKERRKQARDSAHIRISAFFRKNGIEFEEGNNTLLFRTAAGTVAYYPPSQRMQHKGKWRDCSPTYCMNYVKNLRSE